MIACCLKNPSLFLHKTLSPETGRQVKAIIKLWPCSVVWNIWWFQASAERTWNLLLFDRHRYTKNLHVWPSLQLLLKLRQGPQIDALPPSLSVAFETPIRFSQTAARRRAFGWEDWAPCWFALLWTDLCLVANGALTVVGSADLGALLCCQLLCLCRVLWVVAMSSGWWASCNTRDTVLSSQRKTVRSPHDAQSSVQWYLCPDIYSYLPPPPGRTRSFV